MCFRLKTIAQALLGLGFCMSALQGQNLPQGLYLQGAVMGGTNLRHTPRISIPVQTYRAWSGELALEYESSGRRAWEVECAYPRFGLALSLFEFGNPQQLGRAWGLSPYWTVDFWRSPRFRVYGTFALGVGYATRPYHIVDNPENNLLGSSWNNQTILRLGAAIDLSPHWELRPFANFNHFSNGASQFPNMGINTVSLGLGLCHRPNPVLERQKPDSLAPLNRRVQYGVYGHWGLRESSTTNGPKFSVWVLNAEAGLWLNRQHRLKLGLEYEWNGSAAAVLDALMLDETEAAWARAQARRWMLHIGDEMRLGRVSFSAHLGTYLSRNALQPWFLYTRISLRYYLRPPSQRFSPYLMASLKAHQITAEYFSFGLGFAFW